MAKDS